METYVNYVTEQQISGQLMLETYKVNSIALPVTVPQFNGWLVCFLLACI
jgi:hypothetical protein